MKVKSISYKRVANLSNYNSEHLECFAEIEDGEDFSVVADELRFTVNLILEEKIEDMMFRHKKDADSDVQFLYDSPSKIQSSEANSDLSNF